MKIIIAPDSFKGGLSSLEAAAAMEEGVLAVVPDAATDTIPMADGGEGTLEALTADDGGRCEKAATVDPLGRPFESRYAVLKNGVAVIEMSAASGLTLLNKEELDPLRASSYGTGLLIRRALEQGCREFIIAAGGSATNDGGTGMAQALGVRFLRKDGSEIREKMSGGLLEEVAAVDAGGLLSAVRGSRFVAACDVRNVLLGRNGCARVYSPQKGADFQTVEKLEKNMTSFAHVAEKAARKLVRDLPGAGAGGGLGAGLALFLKAELRSGADIVMESLDFERRLENADLILTGEGKIDGQTMHGKAISAIAKKAKALRIPVVAFGGALENTDGLREQGVTSCFSICEKPVSLKTAMSEAFSNLRNAAERVMRLISAFYCGDIV